MQPQMLVFLLFSHQLHLKVHLNVEINLQSLPSEMGIEMRENLADLIEEGDHSRMSMDAVRKFSELVNLLIFHHQP